MTNLMESSSIGTTIRQIRFGIKIMKKTPEISKHISQLKRNGIELNLEWSITA